MREELFGQRKSLKSSLLIGAGFAAAAIAPAVAADAPAAPPATPAADPPKWQPYADLGLNAGDHFVGGGVNIFVPVQQDLSSLLFLNAGWGSETKYNDMATLDIGYRTKVDDDWIVGGYLGFDSSHSQYDNNFNQFALGVEAMSADWDARINGYLSGDRLAGIKNKYELSIVGTTIAILQGEEASYSGFDGEIGYRVYSADDTDIRLYAGGFSFTHSGYGDISGPKARAEINVFDLDELGPQSRLSVQAGVSHDSMRGTDEYIGATLRIPLNVINGAAAQTLDDLDRRMADPIRRNDNVLTQWEYKKPEPVIIYGSHFSSQPTNTLLYVDNSTGAGTFSDPTTFSDATGRGATDNAFIVGTSHGGPIKTDGAKVAAGETISGPGTFTVKGATSGATFTHTFAPGSREATFISGSASKNVFNLGGTNAIYGLKIAGPFYNAIYGHNAGNVTVGDVTIDGSKGGTGGIVLNQDKSGDSAVSIDNVTISNLLGDGISVSTNTADGGASTQRIAISNATISSVGGEGIDLAAAASGHATTINQTIGIYTSSITGALGGGIAIAATGAGGTVSQSIDIDPTVVTASGDGLDILATAYNGGNVSQTASVSDFAVAYGFGDGVLVGGFATGGEVYQNVTLTGVEIAGNELDGLVVSGIAGKGGTVLQHLTAIEVSATHNGYEYCFGPGCIVLGGDGLYVYGIAAASGKHAGVLGQYVTALYSQFDHNAYAGVEAFDYAIGSSAAARQDVYVLNSSITHNGGPAVNYPSYGGGVLVIGEAADGASTEQYAVFGNDTISDNRSDGAVFIASAIDQGFAEQSSVIYGSSAAATEISGNKGQGVWVGAYAAYAGQVEQIAAVYYADISHNKNDGIHIATYANSGVAGSYAIYYSHVTQSVTAAFDTIGGNGKSGVHIKNTVKYGGQVNQYIGLYYNTITHNKLDGIDDFSKVDAYNAGHTYDIYTNLYSTLYVVGSQVSHNRHNGVAIDSYGYGSVYMIDHATIAYSSLNRNHWSGVESTTYQTGSYGLNFQYLALYKSHFDHNRESGAALYDAQIYGPGDFGVAGQEVTIGFSDFSHNKGVGLFALAYAAGNQGRAEQNFQIGYSNFDSNGYDGILLDRVAQHGVYVSGYDCTKVQSTVGGCAFVRQTVQIGYSSASNNAHDGIAVYSLATVYGAIYTVAGRTTEPTLILQDVTADANGRDGLYLQNQATDGSYIFQLAVVNGSHLDHNGRNGIYQFNLALDGSAINYVFSSTLGGGVLANVPVLYVNNSTADFNGGYGLYQRNIAAFGSAAYDYAVIINSHFDHNYSGVGILSGAYYSSLIFQKALVYSYHGGYSSASHNAGGLHGGGLGIAIATSADQTSEGFAIDEVIGTATGTGQFNDDSYFGIGVVSYGAVYNIAAIYGNRTSHDYIGIRLQNNYGEQKAYIGANTISHDHLGVLAANYNGEQIVNVYYYHGNPAQPMGNIFSHDGTNVQPAGFGGIQIIY